MNKKKSCLDRVISTKGTTMKLIDETSPCGGLTPLYYERAQDWYGWTRADVFPCPRATLPEPCPTRAEFGGCACLVGFDIDHPAMWTVPGGRLKMTFEPYHPVDVKALRSLVEPLGLMVDDHSYDDCWGPGLSMWHPGVTRLYVVRARVPALPRRRPRSQPRW